MMENIMDGFVCILCGIVFVVAAAFMLVFPPKKINDFYGYRTNTSKKSQDRWDFSQKFSAWRMIEAGLFLILVSIALDYADFTETASVLIGIGLLLASCVYMIFRTESALKKKFPN
ncbi:SdpI family protein [Flavobacterium sp. MAH-1]|uniref:SdpI family protein n=1 Tax=Flavobacterium agri TaxID=2743471 RepID=A0A7Y8Y0A3_9FLAO|nr:SdpI family protein [Flavobacterium agri]NYA70148.1 SdpI family protein [Flavobacterium agri]